MRKPLLLSWVIAALLLLQTATGTNEIDDDITFDDVPTRPEGPGRPAELSLGSKIYNSLSRIKRGWFDLFDPTSAATESNSETSGKEATTPSTTAMTASLPTTVLSSSPEGTPHSRETRSTDSGSLRVTDDEDLRTSSGSGAEWDTRPPVNTRTTEPYYIFRIRVYVQEFWDPGFANRNSPQFEKFAKNFSVELEQFFDAPVGDEPALPGSRRATVIGIEPSKDDSALVHVTSDLGSKGFDETGTIHRRLKRHLETTSKLGSYAVKMDKAHPLSVQRFTEPNTNGYSPCEADQYVCSDGKTCLPVEKRCDGRHDCEDESDEADCPLKTETVCGADEKSCGGDSTCLPKDKWCDGQQDCPDGSDEADCPVVTEDPETSLSRTFGLPRTVGVPPPLDNAQGRCDDQKLCPDNQTWICLDQFCDGTQDCPDISEETNCPSEDGGTTPTTTTTSTTTTTTTTTTTEEPYCYENEFMCDVTRCIRTESRCNGVFDCEDRSDEDGCPKKPCLGSQFQCDDGSCIEQSQKCNRVTDCSDGSDERDCDKACNPSDFRCSNGTCIPASLKCDGRNDCSGGEDESLPECLGRPLDCLDGEFTCDSGQCIHRQFVCDGIADCQDKTDEDPFRCRESACMEDDFICHDTRKCIRSGLRCDGTRNCNDGSDELNCQSQCKYTEYECATGHCIQASQRCDGRSDCQDGSDERNCYDGQCDSQSQFQCDSGQCVSKSAKCNRVEDCDDGSDESNCIPNEIQLVTSPASQEIEESKEAVFQCRDEGPSRYRVRWLRGDGQPLPEGSRTLNNGARLEIPNVQLRATGTYYCEAVGAPRSAPGSKTTVYLKVLPFVKIPDRDPIPGVPVCQYDEATCYNRQCIPKTSVCDGKADCSDGSDESRCASQHCEANMFMCENRECIIKTWRCDNQKDCLDGSDEIGCEVSKNGTCYTTEFACRSGDQCIPRGMLCDKQRDCADNSDEIGCKDPEIIVPPRAVVQLCPGEELVLHCEASGFPVPIINWRLNWGHVPKKCRMESINGRGVLTCPDIQLEDSGAYSCEAINGRSKFAIPDANVIMRRNCGPVPEPCVPGTFNDLARTPDECIECFCFGRSTECKSANLYSFKLPAPTGTFPLVQVKFEPTTEISPGVYPVQNYLTAIDNGFVIRSPIGGNGTQYLYYSMPEDTHHRNQLKSYGGYITYRVTPGGDTRRPYTDIPDIVILGNNRTLTHRIRNVLARDRENDVSVRIFEGDWQVTDPSENRRDDYATRKDIMMVLANVEDILIRVQYIDGDGIDTTITNIDMDTADATNVGGAKAAFVEQCKCPGGYTGDSCEECASGYVRQPGAYLGVCSPIRDVECPRGYYGAPDRGIECRRCPCPVAGYYGSLTTCRLGSDNRPECDCREGYVGKRCELCDTQRGYTGDARVGDCRIHTVDECSEEGSLSPHRLSDGTCECKPYTTGPRCDQCVQDAFFLSSKNAYGCIQCFCMGTTKECSSSNLYRDSLETRFYSTSPQDFSLVKKNPDDDTFEKITPIVDPSTRELYYDNFDTAVYYWALSPSYLFDKVTSYGGHLHYTIRYTPSPGGMSSKNSAPDVEIRSANRITLTHYSKQSVEPEQEVNVTVPLLEQFWQGEFGRLTDREHLLQALADISGIYIKATYTTSTSRASLIWVSLDTATTRNTGRPKALEVEDCSCLEGYTGTSCEDCAPGFKRAEEGLYLKICEPCDCGGYSDDCDAETGVCRNCRDNRGGDRCERCREGYELTPDGRCAPTSGPGCSACDPRGTITCSSNRCICKTNVEGEYCNRCHRGTFSLSESNDLGCSECYCSEVSTDCQSSSLYMEQVAAFILDNDHGYTLSDGSSTVIRDGFKPNFGMSELGYRAGWRQDRLFWSLPSKLTGDKILSYGGVLSFSQRYTSNGNAEPTSDHDIIIAGNAKSIFYTFETPLEPGEKREATVNIIPGEWRVLDQRNGNPKASRQDILKVLSNVEHILVRASLAKNIDETYISDVFLETATQNPDGERAEQIEVCRCPPEYRGTSCQTCAEGHYKDNYDNTCKRSPCKHGQAMIEGRDYQVRCICDPGWQGNYCDEPITRPSPSTNPPSPQIRMDIAVSPQGEIPEYSRVTLDCRAEAQSREPVSIKWSRQGGRLPRVIDDGRGRLTIVQAVSSDSGVYLCTAHTRSASDTKSIVITIDQQTDQPPYITVRPSTNIEALEGSEINVQCNAGGYPLPEIGWQRISGDFTDEVEFDGGTMKILRARKSDEGEYECTATNNAGQVREIVTIHVRSIVGQLSVYPREINSQQGQTITIRCNMEPPTDTITLRWIRNDRREFPRGAEELSGELTIRNIGPQDAGEYVCTAVDSTNGQKVSEASAFIRVRGVRPPPLRVEIHPSRQTVNERDTATLTCNTTIPDADVTWSILQRREVKGGRSELPRKAQVYGNVLRIPNVEWSDRAIYLCEGRAGGAVTRAQAFLEVRKRGVAPTVDLTERRLVMMEGDSAFSECRASGSPQPDVTWTKRGNPLLPRNIVQEGSLIRLNSLTLNDNGDYVCTANNSAGKTSATMRVEVQTRPKIHLEPRDTVKRTIGESLTLKCYASGVPAPAVRFEVNSPNGVRSVSEGTTTGTGQAQIDIFSLSVEDTGYYTCKATSAAGESEESIYVQVIDNDVNPDAPAHSTFEVDLGGATEIACSHPTTDPGVTYDWTRRDGRPLGRNVQVAGEHLNISNAQQSDAGDYVCEIKDRTGYSQTSIIATLKVIERLNIRLSPPSQVVHVNDNARILCEVIGNYPADITWDGVNRELPARAFVSGGQITFTRIQVEDQGSYRCTAVDPKTGYSVKALARVTVKQHFDRGDNPPTVQIVGDKNISKTEGTSLLLQCVVSDSPNARVEWRRQGKNLPMNADARDNDLQIANLYPEDSGVYICTATSRQGLQGTDRVYVTVDQGCSAHGKIACSDGLTCYESSQMCDDRIDCPDASDEKMCNRRKRNPLSHGALAARVLIEPSVDRIRVGETVDLRCIAEGVFVSEFPTWEKVGGGIADNVLIRDNVLRIHDITTDNAGPYRCWVKKQNGQVIEDEYLLEVQVNYEPSPNTQRPHKNVKRLAEKTKTVRVYDSVDIECDTGLEPPVSFIWTRRNGQLLPNQTGIRIHLSNILPSDAGEYLCVASNSDVKIEFPTFLVVKGTIPRFTQQSSSYLKLKPMAGAAYLKFDLLLSIKPERPNGLILYNGEKKPPNKDFIAIGLRNGRVEFRFDVGSGEAIILSDNTVPMGKWSNITLKRERKEGRLWVNGIGPVIGASPGRYQGLDLNEPMYLGSVPNFTAISPAAGFDSGFVGCISFLKVNDQVEELSKALEKSDVTDCDTCSESRCKNNGVCQESTNEKGYQCLCPRGFSGEDCQHVGGTAACYQGLCNEGKCVNTHGSYKCQCRLGTSGDNCESKVMVTTPSFTGDSFLAYPIPHTTSDFSLNLEVQLADSGNALLSYAGQNTNGNGDFIALIVRDHHVWFTVDTGSGPETISNAYTLRPGQWATILVEKRADELTLDVNGEQSQKVLDARKTKVNKRGLSLHTPLYLGGYDETSISLHPSIYIKDGFQGCVKSLRINGRSSTHLIRNAIESSNIVQCSSVGHGANDVDDFNSPSRDDLCGEQRCQNGGRCDHSDGMPVCACSTNYGGAYCEIRTNECGLDPNPCGSQGICRSEKSVAEGYKCDCFFGYTGPTCQEKRSITTDVAFRRESYIELPGHLTHQLNPHDEVAISMTIQTDEMIGLLFWQGTDGHFMSIGVRDGFIEAEVDHNDNPLRIRSTDRVDDARPHNLTVIRKASDLEITLDGTTVASSNGQPPRRLPSRDSIFIGGLPDPWTQTNGRWKENFVGCITKLRINNGEALDFSKHRIDGRNVRSCLSSESNPLWLDNETK